MPEPHAAQTKILAEKRRFNVVALGRRSGKTKLGEYLVVDATTRRLPVGWFAPSYKLLSEAWRDLTKLLKPIITDQSIQERRLELFGGGVVECWSLDDPDPARSRAYGRVIIDEAAMARHLQEAWTLAIRPTLTDYQGDAWFFSTPRGLNYFHTLFMAGQDALQPDWASWQMPTTCNPFIDPVEIEAARRDMSELAFAQEYLAQFISDGTGVFRGIDRACILEPQPRLEDHVYLLGLDWAKLSDFSSFTVLDVTSTPIRQVALVRFNQIDYSFQLERLKDLIAAYQSQTVIAERNSIGEPLIEQLRKARVPITAWLATQQTKNAAIEDLALALERGALLLLNDPVQKAELQAFTAERLPSGMLRYSAPVGQHDDTVSALYVAWTGAKDIWLSQLINHSVGFTQGGTRKALGIKVPQVEVLE